MENPASLVHALVAIDSTNPDLVPGATGEAEVARFIARWLEDAGLEVHLHESVPGRPNVVAIAHGRSHGRTLMLNGHIDTVGAGGMPDAHQPEIRAGRLYGRGAYDMKGGLAACMLALAEARKLPLSGDVILCAVVDEEFAGKGTMTVAQLYRADGAIVAEPTQLQLIAAHKGFAWLEVETQGVAAHGSLPDVGVDAIVKMASVLAGLEALQQTLQSRPAHPLLGHASVHASLIQGGQELSTYPERCLLSIERRTLPGETSASVEAEIEAILQQHRLADPAFHASLRTTLFRSPLETPEDAAILSAVSKAASAVLGHPPEISGVAYWTDAATLREAGIPSVLLGPSGDGAHADQEWVDLDSVAACMEIYLGTARNFCA